MKYIIISLFILFVVKTNVAAQSFSLAELIRLRTLSYPEFETAVTGKGYHYVNSTDDDFALSYSFAHDESNGFATRHILYSIFKDDNSIHIAHQTSFLSDYKKLKEAANKAGFIYVETGKTVDDKGVYLKYKKGKREVMFISSRYDNRYGESKTGYEIAVD